jgi:hypothetical protein
VSSSADPSFICLSASFVFGTTVRPGEITDFVMDSDTYAIGGNFIFNVPHGSGLGDVRGG